MSLSKQDRHLVSSHGMPRRAGQSMPDNHLANIGFNHDLGSCVVEPGGDTELGRISAGYEDNNMKQVQYYEHKTTFCARWLTLLTVLILCSAMLHPVLARAATPINLILEQGHVPNPNRVAQTCDNFQHLMTVNEFVENNDTRPLAANQDSMYVTEKGGAHLRSKSYSIPAIAVGANINMQLPVGTDKSYRARLPGLHMLYIHLVASGKEISSYPILVEFPKGFCQIERLAPLSQVYMQRKPTLRGGFGGQRQRIVRPKTGASVSMHPTAHIPPPKIRLASESHYVHLDCKNRNNVVTFVLHLRNDGGPLAAHKLEAWVEDDKLVLPYDGVAHEKWMPALLPGQMATVTIPVGVLQRNIGQLPGTHSLAIGYYTSTALQNGMRPIAYQHVSIVLPNGICQPKMRVMPPAQMHLKPGGIKPLTAKPGTATGVSRPRLRPVQ